MVDIVRPTDTYSESDFMDVSNHGNATVSSGKVEIVKDLDTSVEGRDLLIIEDIIDNGRTPAYLVDFFKYRKARSAKIVILLDKPEGRIVDIEVGYVGSNVPNEFVVDYSLDYVEAYRNFLYISVSKPTVYQLD